MEVINGLINLRKKYFKPVVTIGIFDGVHRAHQYIIRQVVKSAAKIRGTSFLITFHPHPLKILSPKIAPPLLTSLEQRLSILSRFDIDVVLVLNFGIRLSRLNAEDFVRHILIDKIGIHTIIIGEDFSFGLRHKGNVNLLKEMGLKFGFDVCVLPHFKIDGITVSSTLVRQAIERGDIEFAARLLGRPVSIYGPVIKGTSIGRLIGYPTANLNYQQRLIPPNGVYAVKMNIGNRWFGGILNIGYRPTFASSSLPHAHKTTGSISPIAEVHIIGFNQNLYGKTIEAVILKKLRDEKKFSSKESLSRQIKRDEHIALSTFS